MTVYHFVGTIANNRMNGNSEGTHIGLARSDNRHPAFVPDTTYVEHNLYYCNNRQMGIHFAHGSLGYVRNNLVIRNDSNGVPVAHGIHVGQPTDVDASSAFCQQDTTECIDTFDNQGKHIPVQVWVWNNTISTINGAGLYVSPDAEVHIENNILHQTARSLSRIGFRAPCSGLLRDQGAESAGRLVAFQGLSNAEIGAGTDAGRREDNVRQAPSQGVSFAAIEIQGNGDFSQNPPPYWYSDYNMINGSLVDYEFDTLIGEHDRNQNTGHNAPKFQGYVNSTASAVSFMLRTSDADNSPCYTVTPNSHSDAIDAGFPGLQRRDHPGGPGLGTETCDMGAYGGSFNMWDPTGANPCLEYVEGVGECGNQ